MVGSFELLPLVKVGGDGITRELIDIFLLLFWYFCPFLASNLRPVGEVGIELGKQFLLL